MGDVIRYSRPFKPHEESRFPATEYDETVYFEWLKSKCAPLQDTPIRILKGDYERRQKEIHTGFEKSKFWRGLRRNLNKYSKNYLSENGCELFFSEPKPILYDKPWGSFLKKTYKKNLKENSEAPEHRKWLTPYNWFQKINNIVRTSLVVKYLSGVPFLAEQIQALAYRYNVLDLKETEWKADLSGYYAVHVIATQKFQVSTETGTATDDFNLEIQIRTQMQELIWDLLHGYYKPEKEYDKLEENWPWDYDCDAFAANYLGHVIHFVDGKIVHAIRRQRGKNERTDY